MTKTCTDMVAELRGYDPKPGCRFVADSTPAASEPDVLLRATKDGWQIELNPATLPRVLVNRRYHAELKRGPNDKASKAWLSECLASAHWLVKALDQRAQTIVKVATEIVKRQQALLRSRRRRAPAADAARSGRCDRNA